VPHNVDSVLPKRGWKSKHEHARELEVEVLLEVPEVLLVAWAGIRQQMQAPTVLIPRRSRILRLLLQDKMPQGCLILCSRHLEKDKLRKRRKIKL
jgi:hypothetical protein